MKTRKKILVLGGGISGLAAADALARFADVTLLEARDRLGGRIFTDLSWEYPIDLGAQVIHGFYKNPIAALSKKLGLKTIASDYYDYHLYGPGAEKLSVRAVKKYERQFEETAGALRESSKSFKLDVPAEDAIDKELGPGAMPPLLLDWFKESHAIYSGAELSSHSAKEYWQDNEFDGPNKMFPGGYGEILRAFKHLDKTDVLTKREAKRIEWGRAGVRVETQKDSFTADAAIVTLPLGVLQSGNVKFSPVLPAWKRRAFGRLRMGVLDAVYLEFPHVFWPEDRDFIGILGCTGEFSRFVNHYRIRKIPVLAGLAGGDSARGHESLRTEQTAARAMKSLRKAFGKNIPEPVRVKAARWASDPFSFGSYSYIPVGSSIDDYDVMAKPVGNKLFFAGEATNAAHPTTVHGAYLSGLREAARILQD